MKIETCKCGVRFVRCEHIKTGKLAPIELHPATDGNILVTGELYEVVPEREREGLKRRGYQLRKNHFATCPNAKDYKRAKTDDGPP